MSFIILIIIILNIFNNNINIFDDYVYSIIVNDNNLVTPIKILTTMGDAIFLIPLSLFLLIILKNKNKGLSIIINLAIVTILNQILKFIFQRPRPELYNLIEETGFSFPSGHMMASTAFYGFLMYLVVKYVKNKILKLILSVMLILIIISIGYSRIYLGVHFTSDVIGGFLISVIYLIIYIKIISKYIEKGEVKHGKK